MYRGCADESQKSDSAAIFTGQIAQGIVKSSHAQVLGGSWQISSARACVVGRAGELVGNCGSREPWLIECLECLCSGYGIAVPVGKCISESFTARVRDDVLGYSVLAKRAGSRLRVCVPDAQGRRPLNIGVLRGSVW